MHQLIQEYASRICGSDGALYVPRAFGEARADGTWTGWIEFQPTEPGRPMLRTGQETSQPTRQTIEYWASGLEAVYFEGAFDRAWRRTRAAGPPRGGTHEERGEAR